jgi:hypothetical protein
VVSATGQPQAGVDIALEFNRRYPHNPLIAIASLLQLREGGQDVVPRRSAGNPQSFARQLYADGRRFHRGGRVI